MTPAEIIDNVASLQNDTAQTVYTDAACLPYLNMALDEIKEILELNDVPLVEDTTDIFTILSGNTRLGYGTNPNLPYNFIEPKNLWESISGQSNFIPMQRREFLPQTLQGIEYIYFRIYVWNSDEFKFLASISNIDLKIDYTRDIIPSPIPIADINKQFPSIGLRKFKTALYYYTGALCSMFIGENETRAAAQATKGLEAMNRALGISIKPKQSIITKRRPYRAGYKMRYGF